MNFLIINTKLLYYGEWYASLTKEEKETVIPGQWVKERLERFSEAITDDLKDSSNPLRSGADTIGIP
jgi:hypothetical protein